MIRAQVVENLWLFVYLDSDPLSLEIFFIIIIFSNRLDLCYQVLLLTVVVEVSQCPGSYERIMILSKSILL